MIRNEMLHRFILEYALSVQDNGHGRPTSITPLWLAAKEKCFECEMSEVLDALYTLGRNNAELTKFFPIGGGFQAVSFERVRNTPGWSTFLMTGYFNIKLTPDGRIRLQRLSEQLTAEGSAPMKTIGKWVWNPEQEDSDLTPKN
jgi:hypothetical protein